jgi:ATP-dependent helicase/nuclease subunit A
MTAHPDAAARERGVTERESNCVVTAGAGTGKTSLLVERALFLVLGGHVATERLAAITFTEKAAAELKRRIAEALTDVLETLEGKEPEGRVGEATRTLTRLRAAGHADRLLVERAAHALDTLDAAFIGTIHALGADLLRRHAMAAHLSPDFVVEDDLAGGLLFEEAWSRFLTDELGPGATRRDQWTSVLRLFREQEIEDVARCLHGFPAAADLLAAQGYRPLISESEMTQEARDLCERIAEHRAFLSAPSVPPLRNSNFPDLLETEQRLFDAFLEEGAEGLDRIDPSSLPVPGFWDRDGVFSAGSNNPRREEMERTAKEALRLLKLLKTVDEAAIGQFAELLRPFALNLREHVRREGVLSFDDLLILARDLLRDVPEARERERTRFDAVLVDEFQDTDPIQYEIVFFLCSQSQPEERDPYRLPLEPGRLFIVGDPKQSIYRFRGADMAAYHRATRHVLASGTSLSLVTSYRSRPEVLEPLNRLFRGWIGDTPDRDIEPEYEDIAPSREARPGEPGVEIWSVRSAGDTAIRRRRAEAAEIAAQIRTWLDAGTYRARDIAILFRALTDLPVYTRALREARIDFVVEGGKAFFERPEIVESFALLRAIANAADGVALLGVLRSGFGGATDLELAEHARRGGPWRWTTEDAGSETLTRAFSRLRELEHVRRTMPLDRWIQYALAESPFALIQIAHEDGPQRIANLRKLATRAALLVRERGLTLEETLDVLAEAFKGERVEGESPLADTSLNAVRLLTVHKAKGLEFPVVIVPDLARQTPAPSTETRVAVLENQGIPHLVVEVADRERTRNVAAVAWRTAQFRHETAETKRLLYVATTRARDRLILVNAATRSRTDWMKALRRVGYVLTGDQHAPFPAAGRLGDHGVWHHVRDGGATPRPAAPVTASPAVAAYRAFEEAVLRASQPIAPRFRNPSMDHRLDATDKDESQDPGLSARDPDLARAIGVTVHRVLERWDFARPEGWKADLPAVVEHAARELAGSRRAELEDEATRVLERFAASSLRAYLSEVDVLGRELPILYRDPEGTTVQGYVDLVYRKRERVHVADYKTDTAASAEQAARYRSQLTDYARAVAGALALSEPPVMEVLFVRAGTRIEL